MKILIIVEILKYLDGGLPDPFFQKFNLFEKICRRTPVVSMLLAIDGHLINNALTFTWSNVMVFEQLANLNFFSFSKLAHHCSFLGFVS